MDLLSDIEKQLKQTSTQGFLIALSGGLDSTVLLSLFAKLCQKQPHLQPSVRAIHIHHGLSQNAESWAKHCQNLCDQFQIPLIIERVQVDKTNGIEAGAREARYQAIKKHLQTQEVLVTAHHLNDQTETFFLALKRGSGLQGLGAMQQRSVLFSMPILRPLLGFTRPQLENYAQKEKLNWITDESNKDNRFDRNFLRNEILPELRERWAYFDLAVQRSAQHCFEQQQLINDLLSEAFAEHCQIKSQFKLPQFRQYSPAKQTALLRMWLAENQLEMPSKCQLTQLINDVVFAKEDANPQFQLVNKVIRRYKDSLYLTKPFSDLTKYILKLEQNTLSLPDDLGNLTVQENERNLIFYWQNYSVMLDKTDLPISIRFGYSGKVKHHPKRPREDIKKIWQSLDIPPWQRNRIPLIFYGDELKSAVGFFCVFKSNEK